MAVPSLRVHGARYQTRDVNRDVEFYTQLLGCQVASSRNLADGIALF
jgi:hypothetical protein